MKNVEISAKKKFSILTKLMKTQKVSNIPPILDNGKVVTDAQAKCKIFNDYFASKAAVPGNDNQVPNLPPRDDINENLSNVNTSYIEVAKLCREIKKSKTSHRFAWKIHFHDCHTNILPIGHNFQQHV